MISVIYWSMIEIATICSKMLLAALLKPVKSVLSTDLSAYPKVSPMVASGVPRLKLPLLSAFAP